MSTPNIAVADALMGIFGLRRVDEWFPLNEPTSATMLASTTDADERPGFVRRTGPFDSLGRCKFSINWTSDSGYPRGQSFFADPLRYVRLNV